MKTTASTFPLLLALILSLGLTSLQTSCAAAGTATPPTQAESAVPKKRGLLSIFKRRKAHQAPQQQTAAAAHPAPQTQQPQKKRFRMPRFKKPDFSRMPRLDLSKVPKPKLRMPKFKKPNLSMPKLALPKMKWPGKRAPRVSPQQRYENAVPNPNGQGVYAIVEDEGTRFYELGPTQTYGPDAELPAGTLVTLRSNDRAWANVILKDGRSGYVGLDQVRLAAKSETPQILPPAPRERPAEWAQVTQGTETYEPPKLPEPRSVANAGETAATEHPLLPSEETVVSVPDDSIPVDSPEVLFDPLLDPVPPVTGPAPFLDDPIPSIEEELRAIQEANEAAETAPDEGETSS